MKHVVYDVETNGLLDEATQVHSLVLRDMDSDRVVSCTNAAPGFEKIETGLSLLSEADRVYTHNGIRFDRPVLYKLFPGFTLSGQFLDTYVAAMTRWAHIKDSDFARLRRGTLPKNLLGKHTIEAWGYRLGIKKVGEDITDWSVWTPLMQARCESDTAVTRALVQRIRAAGLPAETIETEHELGEYLHQQERNGWPFDVEKAVALQGQLAAKRHKFVEQLKAAFPPLKISRGIFIPKTNSTKFGYVKSVPIERFKIKEFKPTSRQQIAERLIMDGWKPEVFTDSGLPKVDADILKGVQHPQITAIRDFLIVDDQLSALCESKQKNSWMHHMTGDKPEGGKLTGLIHIHGGVKQTGTITHRASHLKPPLTQVPKVGRPYGAESRALFCVPPGWVQIGADASGLELRCLAHYMAKYDDGAYAKVLLEGDIHAITFQALIEFLGELGEKVGRDRAKTWMYAFLYGAGDLKLGKILVPGKTEKQQEKIGAYSRSLFFKKLPALKYVVQAVQKAAKKRGYVNLIDGRRCYIRSQHSALNSLLQGTGSVVVRRWIVVFNRELMQVFETPPGGGWRSPWAALGYFHDEVQLATWDDPLVIDATKTILVESIRSMTSHFNFRCPLDGEAKVGRNWMETH